jgi:S1-C subfamily serine protease
MRSRPWFRTSLAFALGAVGTAAAVHLGVAGAGSTATGSRRRTPVVEAVEHVSPAVVGVDAMLSWGRGYTSRSSGAGVIVHPDGYVVTNSHVIRGSQRLSVDRFGPGGRLPARVVLDDPRGDLALLKIETPGSYPYVSLVSTRRILLGETAIAIGNPHGLGDTITVGVVSALGRGAKMQDGTVLKDLVQTDASINTGNSGGPLINLDGELVGIIVSVLPSAKGIAFAIGGDQVRALLDRGLSGRVPARNPVPGPEADSSPLASAPTPLSSSPAPGPSPSRPAPEPRHAAPPYAAPDTGLPPPAVSTPLRPSDFGFEMRDDGCRIFVASVRPGSSAGIAGLQPDDIVLSVDGSPVEDETDLLLAFSTSEPGRVFFLEVRRGPATKRVLLVTPGR